MIFDDHRKPATHLLIILFYCFGLKAVDSISIQAPTNQLSSVKTSPKQASNFTTSPTSSSSSLTATASNEILAAPSAAAATKHLEQTLGDVSLDSAEPRSSSFAESSISSTPLHSAASDHDESIPLATINNHSRNNQPQPQPQLQQQQPELQAAARPPQYVDVSNLVGRNSNGSLSGFSSSAPTLSLAASSSSGGGGLQAKSRSGLPECASQQVCNAIFVRMNYTQKLCECSSNYNWRCSNNLDPQDGHTIELTRKFDKRIYTQIKTCEPLREVRACKSPTDWTLLALQSERSGKAHYVVVCKCPTWAQLEGPYTHNHPPYANIPGIRVYGMLCAHQTARSSAQSKYSSTTMYDLNARE